MPADGTLTIAAAGDVMLGRLVNTAIHRFGADYPWGDLLPVLQQADLFLVNLECALTAQTQPWEEARHFPAPYYFRADPGAVGTLQAGSVSFASTANNHVMDYGVPGLLDTLNILDHAGIAHAGSGAGLAAAREPAVLAAQGRRVAVVAFSDDPPEWAATPDTAGLNYTPVPSAPPDRDAVDRAILRAREHADVVVFSIHWGPNMRSRPPDEFRAFARHTIDQGADIFWGHSAHLVQGVEVYRGKPILYDTGDLINDDHVAGDLRSSLGLTVLPTDNLLTGIASMQRLLRSDLSALFLLRLRPPDVVAVELVPVFIRNMQVNRARDADREQFVQRFTRLCAEMGTEVLATPDRLSIRMS